MHPEALRPPSIENLGFSTHTALFGYSRTVVTLSVGYSKPMSHNAATLHSVFVRTSWPNLHFWLSPLKWPVLLQIKSPSAFALYNDKRIRLNKKTVSRCFQIFTPRSSQQETLMLRTETVTNDTKHIHITCLPINKSSATLDKTTNARVRLQHKR
jgi:hypothetical protein